MVSLSEDGLCRRGMRRDCKGDVVTRNILQIFSETAPKGAYMIFQGIEPLVQDMLQVQPVFSLEYSHMGQSITIVQVGGNWSQYATGKISLMTLKGPYLLGTSLVT